MIVVSDTSPILNLATVGRLGLLRDLYIELLVPESVQRELSPSGIQLDPSWTRVAAAQDQVALSLLLDQLDLGEAEAIVLAGECSAGLLLVDEKRGRRIAIERGLEVTGLLGVLAEAKARGLIMACKPIVDDLIRVAGFWIGDDLYIRYLSELNEWEPTTN